MRNFTGKINSKIIFSLMVILNIAMSIGIELLTKQNITGAEILLIRAVFNLILAFVVALATKQSILPTEPKLQLGAFFCLGLSLLLIFSAYQYISAGSVSTLQRLDIPLLVMIGIFQKKIMAKKLLLSLFAFLLVGVLIIYTQKSGENPMGYFLVLAGVLIIAINTLLQKQIAKKENIVAIMFVVSISSIFWGGIRCWQSHSTFQNINSIILLSIFGLALINLAVFYLVNILYKKHSPELVRFPYLLAAFGTMIVEMLIKQKWENPIVIFGNIAILVVLTILLRTKQEPKILDVK
jgi:drug/metabolite transporter (DMT)-like permease